MLVYQRVLLDCLTFSPTYRLHISCLSMLSCLGFISPCFVVHTGLFAGEYHVHSHLRYLPPICLVSSKHITPELPKPSPISLQPSSHNRGVHTPITSPHKPSSSCIFQPLLCFQKKKTPKLQKNIPTKHHLTTCFWQNNSSMTEEIRGGQKKVRNDPNQISSYIPNHPPSVFPVFIPASPWWNSPCTWWAPRPPPPPLRPAARSRPRCGRCAAVAGCGAAAPATHPGPAQHPRPGWGARPPERGQARTIAAKRSFSSSLRC